MYLHDFCLAAPTTAKKLQVSREAVPESNKETTKRGFCYWETIIQTACRKDISLTSVKDFEAERHLTWASASPLMGLNREKEQGEEDKGAQPNFMRLLKLV